MDQRDPILHEPRRMTRVGPYALGWKGLPRAKLHGTSWCLCGIRNPSVAGTNSHAKRNKKEKRRPSLANKTTPRRVNIPTATRHPQLRPARPNFPLYRVAQCLKKKQVPRAHKIEEIKIKKRVFFVCFLLIAAPTKNESIVLFCD